MVAVLRTTDFATPAERRYNIYTVIHKALRGFMTDTLHRWGKADMTDEAERAAAGAEVRDLLRMCLGHLRHENEFLHPAIEAVAPGSATQTAHDHVEHETAIAEIDEMLTAVAAAPVQRRAFLAQQLYLRLAEFVAENFTHMRTEETVNHAVLIEHYTDAEILAIEQRIVASLDPEESVTDMRWMIAYSNAAERAFLLSGMKRGAPPEAFAAVLAMAKGILSEHDFYKLELALAQ